MGTVLLVVLPVAFCWWLDRRRLTGENSRLKFGHSRIVSHDRGGRR